MKVLKEVAIENLCKVAEKLLSEMEINSATKFAVRSVLREAVNKSCPNYRGNNNRLNVKYISNAAQKVIDESSNEKLISEHILPLSLMLKNIYLKNIKNHKELENLCKNYSDMCLISKKEDELLRLHKLTKTMPNDWDNKDKFARYRATGIEFTEHDNQS